MCFIRSTSPLFRLYLAYRARENWCTSGLPGVEGTTAYGGRIIHGTWRRSSMHPQRVCKGCLINKGKGLKNGGRGVIHGRTWRIPSSTGWSLFCITVSSSSSVGHRQNVRTVRSTSTSEGTDLSTSVFLHRPRVAEHVSLRDMPAFRIQGEDVYKREDAIFSWR